MKTLRLRNGDLCLGKGGFETVSGSARIIQDLRVAIGEPLGVDRFHPGWGSLVDEFIGLPLNEDTVSLLRQEVSRVVGNYMAVQAQRAAQAALKGGAKYATSDLISHVSNISINYSQDHASVTITVSTMSGEELTNTIDVEAT